MRIFVTKESVRMKAVRAHGPGGHQSDRRSKKVQMWIEVSKLPITEAEKKMVRKNLAHRINKNDEFEEVCEDQRSQELNRDIGLERMNALIEQAIAVRAPRIKTEAPREAIVEGIKQRRARYTKKKERRIYKGTTYGKMKALKERTG